MTILDRYVLKQIIIGFVLVLVSMTVLVWLTQSLRMIDMIVTKGVSVGLFFKMTVLVLPNFLQVLSPLALFAVTLFTFIRMQSDKELMVMQAVGMSSVQIMRPVFMLAAFLTAAGYLFSVFVIPAANTELREMRWRIRNDLSHLLLQEGQFNSFKNGLTLYVKERLPDGNVKGVLAYEMKGRDQVSMLAAKSGTVFQEPEGVRVVFHDGTRQEFHPKTHQFSILKFDKYTMSFSDQNKDGSKRTADARELSLKALLSATPEEVGHEPTWRKYKVEFVKRLTSPLYNFTFVFLAMFGILSGFYNRRGQVGRINFTIGAALVVQSLALAFENMAGKNLWFLGLIVLNVFVPILLIYWVVIRKNGVKIKQAAALVLIGLILGAGTPASAALDFNLESMDKDAPVDFEADKVTYDKAKDEVLASGHVVLIQNGIVLETDRIVFNRGHNQIFAPDEVVIKMPDGTVTKTQNVVLSQGMTDIVAGAMETRLYEGTHLGASRMKRTDMGKRVYLRDVIYTPCDKCDGQAPLWQLRAKNMRHDKEDQEFVYKHVFLDVKDVPVFYWPYLQMPDFSVKRKTGFLPPGLSSGNEMKGGMDLPFFVDLADNQNLTITPTFSPSHFPLGIALYEGVYEKGILNVQVSGTKDDDDSSQGHIKADFEYDVTDKWRLKGNLFKVSSDTYFRRYNIPGIDDSQSFLTSDISAERFGNRTYFKMKGYSFQSLVDGVDSRSIPVILPVMDFQYNTQPLTSFGLYGFTAVNSALINTRDHFKSNRLSVTQGAAVPYVTPFGAAVNLTASVRADGYAIDTGLYSFSDRRAHDSYTTGRIYPNMSVEIKYPFVRSGKETTQVLEPIVMAVTAPNGGNSEKIPNVDSLVFEFDDTNLFSANRFSGYDRVETGTRINYGVKWTLFNHGNDRTISALFGQSYRFGEDDMMTGLMGYNNHLSDYVGRMQISSKYVSLAYRFRLDQEDFSPKKSELLLSGGTDPLRLGIDYVFLKSYQIGDNVYPSREEVLFFGSSKLTRNIQVSGYYRYDLSREGGPIETGGALQYDNECTAFVLDVSRSFTRDRDYKGGMSVSFKIVLKTLGGM